MPKTRRLLLALGIAAIVARAAYLFRRPFWFDEIFTLWISRRSPAGIVGALRLDSGPPLFYFLEWPFVRAGEILGADGLARAVSFLAVAALFAAAAPRRASGGPWFAVLLATSPLLFFYSAEARPYALLALLSFLLFAAAFRMSGSRSSRLAAAVAAGLLPWTHYLGGLVVAGSIALCLLRRRSRMALVQAAAILPFAAWFPIALRQPAAAIAWSGESWRSSLTGSLGAFGSWARPPAYFSGFAAPAPGAGAILGGLLILAAIAATRRDPAITDALLFSAIPLALAAAASLSRPVWFPGRTEMAVLPVALWAFARAARKDRFARALAAVAAAAGTIAIAAALIHPPATPPYVATARFVAAAARSGDAIVASDADYLPLRVAADRGRAGAPLLGVPAAIERHPGWFEPGKLADPAGERARLDGFLGGLPAGGRVFFAVPPDPAARSLVLPGVRGKRVRLARPPGGEQVLILER